MLKNSFNYKTPRVLKKIITNRLNVFGVGIALLFILLIGRLYYLQIPKNEYYSEALSKYNRTIIYGASAPRGRIYDRNYRIIVDNVPVRTIIYKKPAGITRKKEIEMAYEVTDIIDISDQYLSDYDKRTFWLLINPDKINDKITEEEWRLLNERKITLDDIERYRRERITEEELATLTKKDLEAAKMYSLMNEGYATHVKIIKNKNVTIEEYSILSENLHRFPGFGTEIDWERVYPYGSTFKSILGNVSTRKQGLPYELKDYYLARGYELNDRVGTSGIELQYESILHGKKAKYLLNPDNTYTLLEEAERGHDIVLTIDIELQRRLDEIIQEEQIRAKKERGTEYHNIDYVIITDPKTGEILAMSGKRITEKEDSYVISDYTVGILINTVTPGSIVKGASMITAYREGAIDIGTIINDRCIKIKDTKEKCSWKNLGRINDINALVYSSNIYQMMAAIKIGGGTYEYNKPLVINPNAFEIYKNTFSEFGLGIKTGIDFPNESIGYQGRSTLPGYLLDFSIGQYDNYTPIQIAQYISTLANDGYRVELHLLKAVYNPTSKDELTDLKYVVKPKVLNKVDIDEKYIKRVQEGFIAQMNGPLGTGYMGYVPKSAGKTGTSQSFIDHDGDGLYTFETYTKNFVGYAPYDDPKMAIAALSPDVSYPGAGFTSDINKRIASRATKLFFEIYE